MTLPFASDEEQVLAAEGNAAERGLGDVDVWRERGIAEEAVELAEVAKDLEDGAAQSVAWLEAVPVSPRPSKA